MLIAEKLQICQKFLFFYGCVQVINIFICKRHLIKDPMVVRHHVHLLMSSN